MKKILSLVVAVAMLMVCFTTIAIAETPDLAWYETMLKGTWKEWAKKPTTFEYPDPYFYGYNDGAKLVATENTVYLVMWGDTFGTDAAWYEVGLSQDGKCLLLLPANGFNSFAGLYIKQ